MENRLKGLIKKRTHLSPYDKYKLAKKFSESLEVKKLNSSVKKLEKVSLVLNLPFFLILCHTDHEFPSYVALTSIYSHYSLQFPQNIIYFNNPEFCQFQKCIRSNSKKNILILLLILI